MTPTGGGQSSQWAKAGELLLLERNHAGATVRMTGPRSGLIYDDGITYLLKFGRRGKQRRPQWHLEAKVNVAGKLSFRSKRAARNYGLVIPTVDPADIDLMQESFRQHVTTTREYRREAKKKELIYRGSAFSRGAAWVRDHKNDAQKHCMFFPGAVCYSPQTVTYNYQSISAARAMCLESHGRPPRGSDVVRHKCGMGHMSCVNPDHLAWGTQAENGHDASLHNRSIFDLSEIPVSLKDAIRKDGRLVRVIAWEMHIPAAAISAIKLAHQ